MSSTSIYPDFEKKIEEDSLSENILNPNILFVEKFMTMHFPQINILRLGGLMGDNRIFSKYSISSPFNKVVKHIHYYDICCIIEKMIEEKSSSKLFNVVAPMHPTKKQIIDYQKNYNFKEDLNVSKSGKIIISTKLEKELNYVFIYPNPIFF